MKRVLFAGALSSLALFLPTREAHAQDRAGVLEMSDRHFESPQNFAFELRFTLYSPQIDSDPRLGGKTPYADTFGSLKRIMLSGEISYQMLRSPHLGTFGPGIGAGTTEMSALAPLLNQPAGATSTVYSAENTNLSIYPLYAIAVLRADAVEKELHIPIVPYAKVGLAVAFWRAYNDLSTSNYDGVAGKGHTFGTMAAIGAALDLNSFDRYTARNFDNEMGVNHTSIFLEYTSLLLDGLGVQAAPLRVGSSGITFGLTFEF
jgi:hypothetical protein